MQAMNQDDQMLNQLRRSIEQVKEDRNSIMRDTIEDRRILNEMQLEMIKMKKEQEYLSNCLNQKQAAVLDYDKMIIESESTLSKLIENSNKLLMTLETEALKMKSMKK